MADSPSPTRSPSRRRMKTFARRCERACCTVATYFPLAFVYGLTTWAVWVDASIGFHKRTPSEQISYSRRIPSAIGIVLYLLLNASYTVAVFTDPGSPENSRSSQRGKYSVLPTHDPSSDVNDVQSITVSSSGGTRYCKKCSVRKPDRTHHCSTCKRCVLKMDHHCPWLATCLGLHNYKSFVLFLIYVSLFCWASFANSAQWVWAEIFADGRYLENFAPVNVILLAVISGIIGLVITGFTGWHLYLCVHGQTTIECLEKTRYLSGVRKRVEQNRQEQRSHAHARNNSESITDNLKRAGNQILEFHANAVPGASRFEEGEENSSPAPHIRHAPSNSLHSLNETAYSSSPSGSDRSLHRQTNSHSDSPAARALRRTYADIESQREQDRYEEYLDDRETSSLPNAFDLGWRRNLLHLFGPNPLLWWLPICNTTGDGWRWEVSEKWVIAQEETAKRKEERLQNAAATNRHNRSSYLEEPPRVRGGSGSRYHDTEDNENHVHQHGHSDNYTRDRSPTRSGSGHSDMSMQTLTTNSRSIYQTRTQKHSMRRDFDNTGEDGDLAAFEVSGSEVSNSEESSDSGDRPYHHHGKGRREGGEGAADDAGWGKDW